MLHPVLVVTFREVFAGMGTTRFLAGRCRSCRLSATIMIVSRIAVNGSTIEYLRASQKISELKGFDKIRVPDHTSILDADVAERLIDLIDLLDALIQ